MTTRIRLTEGQRGLLRANINGIVAVNRRDTLDKLVRLGLVDADADGKGGRLTTQGTDVALRSATHPDRHTFEILTPAEFAEWEEGERASAPVAPTSSLSRFGSAPPKRHTGAERYPNGKNLPDDSDISQASTADLIVSFCTAMDNLTSTSNMTSLAVIGDYAGQLWWEMAGREVQFA